MNIKDSYIHNGTAVLKDVKVENSVLKKILAGKDANDAYLGWETVCDLTGIKPKAAGTADKVGHKLTFSGGVTGTWDGSADKTVTIPTKSSWNYDDVYLKLTGGTLTSSSNPTLNIKNTASGTSEVGIRFYRNTTEKAWIGYHDTYGVCLYNTARGKYLNYKDDGTLQFEGNTVWHAGNDGSGSTLDADLLDGTQLSKIYKTGYAWGNGRSDRPWHLVAEYTKAVSQITEAISFFVSENYGGTAHGILNIRLRVETNGNLTHLVLSWSNICNINLEDFVVTHQISNGIVHVKLYCKCTGYKGFAFRVLSEHSWYGASDIWAMHNASGTDKYCFASIPTEETQIVSIVETIKNSIGWDNVLNKPSTFPVATHDHDDTYLKLIGGELSGDLTLKITSGDSPKLIFQRGTLTDGYDDWRIFDTGGNLKFQHTTGSTTDWKDYVIFSATAGTVTINGKTAYHTGNLTIKTLMGSTAIGDADEPVYWNGSSFVKAGAYPTKASWNYDDRYLKLTGGTMSNTDVVTNLNADLLDGYHASSFYQNKTLRSDQNSIYDLRFNYGQYDKGDFNGTYKDEYPTYYGSYIALTARDKNIGALMFFDAPTSNKLGHIYVRTRGAGDSNTTYSEWGTIAYLTDNVASSSKWINARTITLTGSVTGSVSIDGSSNVTLNTTTNHTHQYLPLSGGTITGVFEVPDINSIRYNMSHNVTYSAGYSNAVSYSPLAKYIWHDILCFGANGWPTYYTSADGSTWSATELNKSLFIQKDSNSVTVLNSSIKGCRWVWNSGKFHACQMAYLLIGTAYVSSSCTFSLDVEKSVDGSTWTSMHSSTDNRWNAEPFIAYLTNGLSNTPYFRITMIRTSTSGNLALASIKGLSPRLGNQGLGKEVEFPYTWDSDNNITITGSFTASSFKKTGGTASQFLKADGSVDSNTYSKSNHTHTSVLDIGSSSAITFAYSKAGLGYNDYTYLAGWYGSELRAINKSQFAQASHTHTKSQITDFPTSLPANGGNADRTKFLETFHQKSTTNTYGSQYTIWAQWSDATNVRLKCTNYTVWTDKADNAINADKLDNYHAGVTNGSVGIFVPWPNGTTLKNEGLIPSEYGTSEFGHPDNVYLQSICKWAIAHYTSLGNITLIGAIAPNSSGTCILHLYSSDGKDSSTLLPRYCSGTYTTLSGYIYNFGTVNYNWYYRQVSAGYASSAGSATTSTYASNVGSAGTAGTNYVTASKVISACNWYDTMIGSDSDTVINRWSEIVSFVAGFKETPDLATFLSNNYLAKAGGTMTGPLKWKDNNALPQQTSPQYFLCIDAFDAGGTTKWAGKADTLNALTGLTSTAIGDSDEPVYWNGAKFVKAGAYPTKSSWNYDDVYLKLSGGTLTGYKNVLTLSNNSGGDIGLKFSRNTNTSWEIIDTGGNLKFNELVSNTSRLVLYENSQGGSAVFKGLVSATGFSKLNSSDSYILLGGGGHKLESNLSVKYASSAGDATNANYFVGCTNTITVAGDANTYYPVMVSTTTNKKFSNIITVWKDLGSKTASYPENHSNGSSSMLYRYDIRNCYWDGNGGYCTTLDARYMYARLVSETKMLSNGVGNFCIWLRGGGTEYTISTSWNISSSDITVYYSSTNVGSSTYPVTIAPRTDIGNGGVYNTISIPCNVKYASSAGSVAWSNVTGKPFNWSGQSGQPTWLWGSNDGTNYYVWNPSNFSVNYANSAGNARNLLGRTTTGSDYDAIDGNLVFAEWNTHNDNRWYLKAKGFETRVGYTNDSDKLDGYHETSFYRYRGNYEKSYTAVSTDYTLGPGTYTTSESGYSGTLLAFNSSGSASAIQFWTHYRQGNLYYRTSVDSRMWSKTDGSWTKILDSDSYTEYTVKKDGTGASGTWSISITGNAKTATNVAWSGVTDKPTFTTWSETSSVASYSLSNAAWTNTITLPTIAGSYILNIVSGNSTLTGVFSIGASDNAKDEISLHLHGNGPRLYARTNGTTLQLSSNDASATSRSVTIKYRRMI